MQPNDENSVVQPVVTQAGKERPSTALQHSAPIRIELAGEPKGKGRARFSRKNGIAYTPAATRTYEGMLRFAAQQAMAGRTPLDGPLSLNVDAWMSIPASWSKRKKLQASVGIIRPTGRPDYDNLLKALDALNGVVWVDDARIVSVRLMKAYSERPRLVVSVEGVR